MRPLLALGALLVSFSAFADGLRIYNPNDAAVAATTVCETTTFTQTIAPHGLNDVVDMHGCRATSAAPLLVLETGAFDDGVEWQRAVGPAADGCPSTVALLIPSFACRFGMAVVAVDAVPGASYAWSIDGGSFIGGLGTERVTVALGGADTVKIDVAIATPGCTRTASGVIALRDAFVVAKLDAGAGYLGQSRTITWSYANGTPTSQTLSGTDFAPVTLPNDARSYSYVPLTDGDKNVVLDARSGAAPATGRHRAAGRGTAAATECSVAHTAAAYRVDCTRPDATIVAPSSTNIDTPFTARVDLGAGATAKWTIANGTPATATGDSVVIKANGSGAVDLSVVVSAGSCSTTGTKHVTVDGTFACDDPTVSVAVLRNDCSGTVVEARFSGKPPFSGTWNDGQQFSTSDRAIDRAVTAESTLSIATFRDAVCAGPKSNSVSVAPNVVSAKLTAASGSCANAPIVATFFGTPPFTGTWSDGVTFSTGSAQISRTVSKAGPLWLEFKDALCPQTQTSNTINILDGSVTVALDNSSSQTCARAVYLNADFAGGVPPYTLTWSDGVTQTAPIGVTRLTRYFSVPQPSATLGVSAAHDAVCALKVSPPIAVTGKPLAQFYLNGQYCVGQTVTATLYEVPGAGSSVEWSVTNGTIVSGQGTRFLNFTGAAGSVTVVCKITTSAGCTDASSTTLTFSNAPAVPTLSLTPGATVTVGASVTIAWTNDANTYYSSIDASTTAQPTPAYCYNSGACSAIYTAKTTGTVKFTVHAYGRCGQTVNGSTTLTVTP
jgi:hypothetical protein